MDPVATISGLASGIQFRDLVDQIIAVESRPIRLAEGRAREDEIRSAAWDDFRNLLRALDGASGDLSDGTSFRKFLGRVTASTDNAGAVGATVSEDAQPGTYSVEVLSRATQQKVGGGVLSARDEALGFTGEFLLNGRRVEISATDSLNDVAAAINRLNTGTSATGVSAGVVGLGEDQFRLVLTADRTGTDRVSLVDGQEGVLRTLGLLDAGTEVREGTSDGALSRAFTSNASVLGGLLEFGTLPPPGAVTLGDVTVDLDLSTQSLQDVATAINDAATLAGSNVSAQVLTTEDADGDTVFKLDISGTTAFSDNGRILEALGVLRGSLGAAAQQIAGNAFTDGDGTTAATASTLLTDLWVEGASAAVQTGDTLALQGTRGDGTTFERTFTIQGGDTLQDLLDDLNDAAGGFGAGSRTATASISGDGRLVVTDDTGGSSELALNIVARNEGGGALDFGAMEVTQAGLSREIAQGSGARVLIDGNLVTSDTNTVTSALTGVTLQLNDTTDGPVTVGAERDLNVAKNAIQAFVDAFNSVQTFVSGQFAGAADESEAGNRTPLSGDPLLRNMRSILKNAMQAVIPESVGGDYTRLASVGIEIQRNGTFSLDSAVLDRALRTDFESVARLFGESGQTSTGQLEFFGATDDTVEGTYDVNITQAATQAGVLGVGFAGTYVDDASADTLVIRDLDTDYSYSVSLLNGMTATEIVEAINAELRAPQARQIQASTPQYQDALGTVADENTTLDSLFDAGGVGAGVTDGDVLTLSGTRSDGSSFSTDFTVVDATTQTLGDLRIQLAAEFGDGVTVSLVNGKFTVTEDTAGRSEITLSLTSDNAGGGTLSFGTVDVITDGRSGASILATESGGQIRIDHEDFGSIEGFEISFLAGGTDGSASLGLTAGIYTGQDVAGTIGGVAATGAGRILTGGEATPVDGLKVLYEGSDPGNIGTVTFTRGVGSVMERALEELLGADGGSVRAVVDSIDDRVRRAYDRIDEMERRLEFRREQLLERFVAMEAALAQAQAQANFLLGALGSLPQGGGSPASG